MAGRAKARLIYSTISASERVTALGAKGALVYTWMLAHADDQGRLVGGPEHIKALVVPLIREITVEDADKALLGMRRENLIRLYLDLQTGRELVQVTDWWEYNRGLRFAAPSKYPPTRRLGRQGDPAGRHGKVQTVAPAILARHAGFVPPPDGETSPQSRYPYRALR
jgi:hypothetical protein